MRLEGSWCTCKCPGSEPMSCCFGVVYDLKITGAWPTALRTGQSCPALLQRQECCKACGGLLKAKFSWQELICKNSVFIFKNSAPPILFSPHMGCLSIFLVPRKYKSKPLHLTFSFSSVMSLHCDTCTSQISGFKGDSDYSFWKIPHMHWCFKGIISNHVTFQAHNPVHQLIQLPREESGLMTST